MKKTTCFLSVFLLLIILSVNSLKAQNTFISEITDTSNIDWLDAEYTPSGYYLLGAGGRMENPIQWVKTDLNGNIISSKSISLCSNQPIDNIGARFIHGNGFICCYPNTCDSAKSFITEQVDSNGSIVWAKSYVLPYLKQINSVNISFSPNHHGYWITGTGINHAPRTNVRGFIIRIDSTGNVVLNKMMYEDTTGFKTLYGGNGAMVEESKNSEYFLEEMAPFESPGTLDLFKADSSLNIKWTRKLGFCNLVGNDIILKNEQVIPVWSIEGVYDPPYFDFPSSLDIADIDTNGKAGNCYKYQVEYFGNLNCVRPTLDNGFIISGGNMIGVNETELAIKLDSFFNFKWDHLYAFTNRSDIFGNPMAYSIRQTPDKGFAIGGYYFIKTDSNGLSGCRDSSIALSASTTVPTNDSNLHLDTLTVNVYPIGLITFTVSDTAHSCPYILSVPEIAKNEMLTLYPNPNKGVFSIKALSQDVHGRNTVEIYNMLGEKIYDEPLILNSGSESLVNINTQPAGLYLCRIVNEVGTTIFTSKLIIE